MYGDMAHGSVLFLFGLYLCFFSKSLKGTALEGLLSARYLIALMGFFAIYCGFMYNDFLSLSFNIFGSAYSPHTTTTNNCNS